MKILVVVGNCLKVNSSANLCHLAYIKGFIDYGCDVTVISMSDTGQIIDDSIELPKPAKYEFFNSSLLLKFINPNSRKKLNKNMENQDLSIKTRIFNWARSFILKQYAPFGYSKVWVKNVVKTFMDDEQFDLVLSLSSPVTSHIAAYQLINNNKISCKTFCEVWEDPWQYDLYKGKVDPQLLSLEYEITQYADKVLYVSPITLEIQKSLFTLSVHKMDWLPLPYYYSSNKAVDFSKHYYGYFGDYFPHVRNLANFYDAAKELSLNINICGMPDNLFQETSTICINERLPLNELKQYEAMTNVLVFLCNLKGGQIPGKIYQYAATMKKILFILDGTDQEKLIIKKYFAQFNRFYFCNNNKEDIIKTIIKLENNEDIRVENCCLEYFSPKNIACEILKKNGLINE